MAVSADIERGAVVRDIDGAAPEAEVIFASIDSRGTPGALNGWVLRRFGLESDFLPNAKDLVSGYTVRETSDQNFCFVVTVGQDRPATLLHTNLSRALVDPAVAKARSLWIPLMGTGAGGLSPAESREIIHQCLNETDWSERPGVKIVVSGLPAAPSETTAGDTYSAERTRAVEELLRTAGRLRRVRRDGSSSLSTTLLFFALAESGSSELTPALAADPAARGFRVALQRLAGSRYEQILTETFEVEDLGHIAPSANLPAPTANVVRILAVARTSAGAGGIGVHEVITALLNFASAGYLKILQKLIITAQQLLDAYLDERSQFIESVLLSDVAGATDRLGYARYSTAIAKFLAHEKTPPPLSISIQAPWGVGKSSLMQQIRRELDPKGAQLAKTPRSGRASMPLRLKDVLRFLERRKTGTKPADDEIGDDPGTKLWTVWFNAWKYDTSEQVWAGLVTAIVDQISDRLPLAKRELFLLRLQLARIDDGIVRKKVYDRIINLSWSALRRWIVYAFGAVMATWGLATAAEQALDWKVYPGINLYNGYLLLPLPFVLTGLGYLWQHRKARNEPASFSLAEYLQVPPYSEAVGSIHRIHEDLLRVLALTPRLPAWRTSDEAEGQEREDHKSRTPIVIFIDDLDRCSPSKIARVVEGVSMFWPATFIGASLSSAWTLS